MSDVPGSSGPAAAPSSPVRGRRGVPGFRLQPPGPHAPLRTFHPRRSPLGAVRRDALDRLWPRLGFTLEEPGSAPLTADGLLDVERLFGRRAPLVLEIGSGMGEAVVAMAGADPDRDYLAAEAHLPGIANLLRMVDETGVGNVRVLHGDAMVLLRDHLPDASLDAVHVFFPDPWPKPKHHKRRVISPANVAVIRSRLVPGGTLHCATDWAPYAATMLTVLDADPGLTNPHGGFAPRPAHRPVTKFEARGLALGHEVADVVVHRV